MPNRSGSISSGEFEGDTFIKSNVLAHEMLHLVGLDDRYWDYYRVRGKDYPLPDRALPPSKLAAFARRNKLPAPPAGRVINKDRPGTSGCDFMGRGELRDCRRIAKRDLKWIDSRAAVRVVAEPGDLLLNKDAAKQNFGVAFRSRVTALPGGTTTAEGVSVVCIDKIAVVPARRGVRRARAGAGAAGLWPAGRAARPQRADPAEPRRDGPGDAGRGMERHRRRPARVLGHRGAVAGAARTGRHRTGFRAGCSYAPESERRLGPTRRR